VKEIKMDNGIKRTFILGDPWIYYKIYSGAKTSDYILTEIIKPAAEKLLATGIIDKWFFIRYADPKHHIRVRFHFNNPENVRLIINSLYPDFKKLISQDLIWKIQTDTYQREIERYGEKTIELAEELFYYDSKMIVNFLDLIEGEKGEELRWLFGLRMIDVLLDSFKFTIEDKCALLEQLKTGFANEFEVNRFLKKQLDDKFRKEREKINEHLTLTKEIKHEYVPILEVFDAYTIEIKPIVEKIKTLIDKGHFTREVRGLLSSFIHMTMNRLFKSKNRVHEVVCYDFLYRYYRSLLARAKNS